MNQTFLRLLALVLLLSTTWTLQAAEQSIEKQTENLKKQVIDLNRDLFKLEEELLYPANTQMVVFLAVDTKKLFQLDSVELKIDGVLANTYLYSDREIQALNRGGVQRFYMGNISAGPHRVEATFNGRGGDDRYFRRQASLDFDKKNTAKFVELQVKESRSGNLPDFLIREFK